MDTALHFGSEDLTLDIGSWYNAIRLSPVNGRPLPRPRDLFSPQSNNFITLTFANNDHTNELPSHNGSFI